MQHFSNYFVQILVIRSKCRAGAQMVQEVKKYSGVAN